MLGQLIVACSRMLRRRGTEFVLSLSDYYNHWLTSTKCNSSIFIFLHTMGLLFCILKHCAKKKEGKQTFVFLSAVIYGLLSFMTALKWQSMSEVDEWDSVETQSTIHLRFTAVITPALLWVDFSCQNMQFHHWTAHGRFQPAANSNLVPS